MNRRRFNFHLPDRWQYKPLLLPLITALLSLFLMSKPGATNEEEIHAGEAANGVVKAVAFHAWHPAEGLTEFTLTYTTERR